MKRNKKIIEIRNMIAKDHISKAIMMMNEFLINEAIDESNIANKLLLLSSQFEDIKKKQLLNLPHLQEEKNKIVYGIINLLEELEQRTNELVVSDNLRLEYDQYIERKIKIKSFVEKNENPILVSGVVIVFVLSWNSLALGFLSIIFLVLIGFFWDEIL